ncbi:hypothetical protein [Streptomyces sp. OE57]|uniref:hypothetical protein n=1 Tax=Streptomyces lacaronensis TaxID=3379885 RepID=UPI0039B72FED
MDRSREWIFERIRRDRRPNPAVSQRKPARRYRVSRKKVVKAADRFTFRCTLLRTGTGAHRLQATEAEHHTAR